MEWRDACRLLAFGPTIVVAMPHTPRTVNIIVCALQVKAAQLSSGLASAIITSPDSMGQARLWFFRFLVFVIVPVITQAFIAPASVQVGFRIT